MTGLTRPAIWDEEGASVGKLSIRRAERADVAAIAALLRDDPLGSTRETDSISVYEQAFDELDCDSNQLLCVVADQSQVIGTMQVTIISGLARAGARRGLIEAVRIASHRRSEGIGEAMFQWAINYCRERGCALVQLTTDKSRPDAHRFYDRIGFSPTHIGYKLEL